MDLNNEMILMRKHFKNAKVRVVRKLIRHISGLKHKKGTEKQLELNKKRIEKLGDEISVVQNLVPDKIFKYLLTSNSTLEDLSKQPSVSLHERACVRIGLVPFIRQRMKDIRQSVNKFDKVRSNKDEITSLKIVEKLQSIRKDNQTSKIARNNEVLNKSKEKASTLSNTDEMKEEKSNVVVEKKSYLVIKNDEKNTARSKEKKRLSDEDSDTASSNNEDEANSHREFFKFNLSSERKLSPSRTKKIFDSDDASKNENDTSDDEDHIDSLSIQQSDVDSNFEEQSIEVVLPNFYNETKDTSRRKQRQILSNLSEVEAVTEIFDNAGEGYADSDEEEAAVKRRRWANFESDEDDFFISNCASRVKCRDPTLNAQLKKLINMNPTEVRKSEEWTNPALSPLHALNPVNFASEGKNETSSQPGRNKFSQFSKPHGENVTRSWKKKKMNYQEQTLFRKGSKFQKKPFKRESKQVTEHSRARLSKPSHTATERLHPSWQASKKKKEQNKIMKFTGTRITFSDSD